MEKESHFEMIKRKLEEIEKKVHELMINKPEKIDEELSYIYEGAFKNTENMIRRIEMEKDATARISFNLL
jgi:hypothetical protein